MQRERGAKMGRRARGFFVSGSVVLAFSLGLCMACDEKVEPKKGLKLEKKLDDEVATPSEEPKLKPATRPQLAIDDVSARVGWTRAFLTNPQGQENVVAREQLASDLAEAKAFLEGQELVVEVDRKAKPEWVSIFVEELFRQKPSHVKIQTETRPDLPKAIEFTSPSQGKLAPCTLVGFISKDRSTSIWKISGGAARRRPRGLSGPDLTRTADTVSSAIKGCASDVFVVHAIPEIEWGMIYDLAGAGLTAPKSTLKRALLPKERPTPGQPFSLD
jgi:hypothetical protein